MTDDTSPTPSLHQQTSEFDKRKKELPQAIDILSQQQADLPLAQLIGLITRHYDSIEVARLVARHPSIPIAWLAQMLYFLPDDAKKNPKLAEYQQTPDWDKLYKNKRPYRADPYYRQSELYNSDVCEKEPLHYKVNYWLKHGDSKDKRFVLAIDNLSEDWLMPYVNDKSAHLRKAIASRGNLSIDLAQKLQQDKAKTVRLVLAENTKCPPAILAQLATDTIEQVAKAAVSNKSCPKQANQLSIQQSANLQAEKTAKKKAASKPRKTLDQLTEQEIIAQLALPTTSSTILAQFALRPLDYVKSAVALHQNTAKELLVALSKEPSSMVKQSVAFNPRTPQQTLQTLIDENQPEYNLALAQNPSLTDQQQLQMIDLIDDEIRVTLADTTDSMAVWTALKNSPPSDQPATKCPNWRDSIELMFNPKTKGLYDLQVLRENRSKFFAKLMARHPKCPKGLIKFYAYYQYDALAYSPVAEKLRAASDPAVCALSYDDWKLEKWFGDRRAPGYVADYYLTAQSAVQELKVCRKAVENSWASLRLIQDLVYHPDLLLRKKLAQLPNITPFMCEILARDEKPAVRELLAKNPSCTSPVLAMLASDTAAAVMVAAKQNKSFKGQTKQAAKTPALKNKGLKRDRIRMATQAIAADVLSDLAADKLVEVRLAVVNNPNTPLEALQQLALDTQSSIRDGISKNPSSTTPLIESLFNDEDKKVRYSALVAVTDRKATSLGILDEDHDDYDCENRSYDEATFAKFYQDPSLKIQRFVARHTSNSTEQIRFYNNKENQYHLTLAINIALDSNIARDLIADGDIDVLSKLITKTHSEEIYFATLKAQPSLKSCLEFNAHLIAKPHIQTKLLQSSDPLIRQSCAVALTQHDFIMQLATDEDKKVRLALCMNQHLKPQHIKTLLDNATTKILDELSYYHPKMLAALIIEFTSNTSETLKAYIAKNFEMTEQLEAILAQDPSTEVRKALAENGAGGLSRQTRKILKNDSNEQVRDTIHRYYK